MAQRVCLKCGLIGSERGIHCAGCGRALRRQHHRRINLPPWLVFFLSAFFFPIAGALVWFCDEVPVRCKRTITGTFVFPAGAYFLWRHSSLPDIAKMSVVAVASVGLLLAATTELAAAIWICLGLAFFGLYHKFGTDDEADVRFPRRVSSAATLEAAKGVLAIERTETDAEREMLISLEFCRIADRVLPLKPEELKRWPSLHDLNLLRDQAAALAASAGDPSRKPVESLVEPTALLGEYCERLTRYRAGTDFELESVRVLARDRVRLRKAFDAMALAVRA